MRKDETIVILIGGCIVTEGMMPVIRIINGVAVHPEIIWRISVKKEKEAKRKKSPEGEVCGNCRS